jgi:hypothetical protein
MHGSGGAKVAFGQLMWRLDVLLAEREGTHPPWGAEDPENVDINRLSQSRDIEGLNAVIPTYAKGEKMNPEIPNTYHQLKGYGDVYLYWTVEPEESGIVTECHVGVTGSEGQNLQGAPAGTDDHLLTNEGDVGTGLNTVGTYRVKIGTVNVGSLVTQDLTSDVYWSAVLLEKDAEIV